ncbi:MAG: hypothetical protein LUQ25_09225 [Methanoregulaceae archaeon]|nr:hypothetical protein [Methanoregulaceae archaeon]
MGQLRISPEKAVLLLDEKVSEIERMAGTQNGFEYYDFVGWCSKVWSLVDEIYEADDPHPEDIRSIGAPRCSCSSSVEVQQMLLEEYHSRLLDYLGEIRNSMKATEQADFGGRPVIPGERDSR